ncbi:MAG: hypothetical protein ACI88A_003824, partial [Paraglaciecola sp.]
KGNNAEVKCPRRSLRAGFKTIYAAVTTFDLDPLGLQIVTLPKWL